MHHKNALYILLSFVVITLAPLTTASAIDVQLSGGSLNTPAFGNHHQPTYYPATFQVMGSIHKLNSNGDLRVTGSSQAYTLSPNVLVHSMSTKFSSRHELRLGAEIGFSFNRDTNVVTEIWLLPQGALPKN